MLRTAFSYSYRVRKPRIQDHNTQALAKYRRELREARRKNHLEATQYHNKIEDEYLQRHHEMMKERHYKNECQFRKTVVSLGYKLQKNMERYSELHDNQIQKLKKHIHTEEVKKINRNRIKKILEYESSNYWLSGENVDNRVANHMIFPPYVGSTEYYHKMYAEAIAYENFDLRLIEQLGNTEAAVVEKNKILIPLYKEILVLMKKVHTNQYEEVKKNYNSKLAEINSKYPSITPQKIEEQRKAEDFFNEKKQSLFAHYNNPATKRKNLVEKLSQFISLLTKWKEYTSILSMTSTEVMKNLNEGKKEEVIQSYKTEIEEKLKSEKDKAFVDAVEEDTDDEEISLGGLLKGTKKEESQDQMHPQASDSHLQLEALLKQQQQFEAELAREIDAEAEKMEQAEQTGSKLAETVQFQEEQTSQTPQKQEADEFLRNMKETTTSIEVLKQQYQEDKQIIDLLNQVGQVTIDYPNLFRKVWQRCSE